MFSGHESDFSGDEKIPPRKVKVPGVYISAIYIIRASLLIVLEYGKSKKIYIYYN